MPNPHTILIAHADAAVREAVHSALMAAGWHVTEAISSAEVFATLADPGNVPELVLLSADLPPSGGLVLLKDLSSVVNGVIVLAEQDPDTSQVAVRAMRLGAFDVVWQPSRVEDVLRAVERWDERRT